MRSSKFQSPKSRETSNSKIHSFVAPNSAFGRRRLPGTCFDLGTLLACAACYGRSDSTLAQGMNWGIFTLMGVILTVLTCIALFFVHIVRKEEAAVKLPQKDQPTDL